ncbi:uncharacterized protein LOC134833318 [Culicoides brevitarsis]|uniref:uncharacterized protein LOC134833318 n=1 Tax=Culicoides brevitarsis TaxID=469753 RepID=UPI00307BD43D
MMLFSLNVDKIGVKYKKNSSAPDVQTFRKILQHEEGIKFCDVTKEWMDFLVDSDLDIVKESRANECLMICKKSRDVQQISKFSCVGVYCSPKKSATLCGLLKERSQLMKVLKDEKGSTYIMEKLFRDFDFYRPEDVLTCYSSEAFAAMHKNDMNTARLYLKRLENCLEEYGTEIHEDSFKEFEERISYLKSQLGPKNDETEELSSGLGYKIDFVKDEFVASQTMVYGDFIFEDTPRVCLLQEKGFQCDYCHEVANLLPCFDCHCVFYCSSECEMEDAKFHKYECPGLRSKILYLCQNEVDVRNLVLTMYELKDDFLNKIDENLLADATDLWQNFLLMHAKNEGTPYYNFFYQRNNVDEIIRTDFQKLCMKTLQTIIYLEEYTTFIDDFFGNVLLEGNDIEIFLCALAFRHAVIQRTKLMHFKYDVTNKYPKRVFHFIKEPESKPHPEFVKKASVFVEKFLNESLRLKNCNDKILRQLVKRLEKLYAAETDKRELEPQVHQTFLEQTTKGNYFQKLFLKLAAEQEKSSNLMDIFKLFAYVVQTDEDFHVIPTMNAENQSFEQILTCLYPYLTNFKHSCAPNTALIPRSRGRTQVYAANMLNKNTPITISYGPHYQQHCRQDRRAKLAEMCVDCKCIACTKSVDFYEELNNEECKKCFIPIYERDGKCLKCDKKTFVNIPKHIFISCFELALSKYRLPDLETYYEMTEIVLSVYQKFLPSGNKFVLKKYSVKVDLMIMSSTPLESVGLLLCLNYSILEMYPALSLELITHLHKHFKMFFYLLTNLKKHMSKTLLRAKHDIVMSAIKRGSEISLMIKVSESAWNFKDGPYADYELLNLHYGKVVDELLEVIKDKNVTKSEKKVSLNEVFDFLIIS